MSDEEWTCETANTQIFLGGEMLNLLPSFHDYF